ncbi:hypothetical protein GRX03_11445 [Halovenus sp. WSH3]|uniref:Secreted glycoprotein n=1 Tax=Halovenus carboxidivorans TaxID=2692199 RepID=A0A6B0T9H1_9EURY|nr:hypothetical protein [Halovenus carboxidivorans]MXR52213.1 hypothetical protein [Halovenus carboxidivorans]
MTGRLGADGPIRRSRGVSITLNYVLVLGISSVLVTGLIVAGGTFVEDQRDDVAEGEANVIGTHIAGNIEQVDRYVEAGNGTETAYVNQTFQPDVSGAPYRVTLVEPDASTELARLRIDVQGSSASVEINVSVRTPVIESQADGGAIAVIYDDDEGGIRITNA